MKDQEEKEEEMKEWKRVLAMQNDYYFLFSVYFPSLVSSFFILFGRWREHGG